MVGAAQWAFRNFGRVAFACRVVRILSLRSLVGGGCCSDGGAVVRGSVEKLKRTDQVVRVYTDIEQKMQVLKNKIAKICKKYFTNGQIYATI